MNRDRGFSLLEVVVSSAIVGVLVVASLNAVGATAKARALAADRARASMLANDLLAEILAQAWVDPQLDTGLIGLDLGESTLLHRSTLDDVDDYHGLSESPPLRRDGTLVPGGAGYRRTVTVEHCTTAGAFSLLQTGLKRITVTVFRGNVPHARVSALRSKEWDRARP
ncbi:MAG: prepilin-type N-terminal cleavage/methylation domain-containing protein [Phycisphaerales bacterium]|nr:prepilin-type N-terminal cleavage/methylation domain-containing protein [Phycisphaerales bacterium]